MADLRTNLTRPAFFAELSGWQSTCQTRQSRMSASFGSRYDFAPSMGSQWDINLIYRQQIAIEDKIQLYAPRNHRLEYFMPISTPQASLSTPSSLSSRSSTISLTDTFMGTLLCDTIHCQFINKFVLCLLSFFFFFVFQLMINFLLLPCRFYFFGKFLWSPTANLFSCTQSVSQLAKTSFSPATSCSSPSFESYVTYIHAAQVGNIMEMTLR